MNGKFPLLLLAVLSAALLTARPARAAGCTTPMFTPRQDFIEAEKVVLADFNADGKQDLALAQDGVDVWLGTAPAVFVHKPKVSPPGVGTVSDMAAGNFNKDAFPDLAVLGQSGTIGILIGNGDGTFSVSSFAVPSAVAIATGDFNGDNVADLAVTIDAASPTLNIYLSDGNGTFTAPLTSSIAAGNSLLFAGVVDSNGTTDVILGFTGSSTLSIYKGNGDGSFAAPGSVTAGLTPSAAMVAFLNGDGLPDLVVANKDAGTVTVLPNNGSGGYATPLTYSTVSPAAHPVALAIGDFLHNGQQSLAVANLDHNDVAVFPINSDGSLGTRGLLTISSVTKVTALAGYDFTGDGRVDLIIGTRYVSSSLYANVCGATTVGMTVDHPTINPEQSAKVTFTAVRADPATQPPPTGTVTFSDGGSPLGTLPLSPSPAFSVSTIMLSGSVGDHLIGAHYNGDSTFDPNDAAPLTLHITNVRQTVAVTLSSGPYTYGAPITIDAVVNSTGGPDVSGPGHLILDGHPIGGTHTLPYHGSLTPNGGAHTLAFTYDGDATHAPASSPTYNFDVAKADAQFDAWGTGVAAGQSITVHWSIFFGMGPANPTGPVTIREGANVLGTAPEVGTFSSLNVGPLPAGAHVLTVDYAGDSNFNAASVTFRTFVVSGTPLSMIAHFYRSAVQVVWSGNGAASYRVWRKEAPGDPFVIVGNTSDTNYSGLTSANHAYVYYIEALDGQGQSLGTSNRDLATTVAFSDDPAVAGTTAVKAQHLTELTTAVNLVRALAGQSAVSFTEGTPAAGGFIRASHIANLRSALDAARAALTVPSPAWTDPALTAGTTLIRALHVLELRDGVR